jgi:hypothetical protein
LQAATCSCSGFVQLLVTSQHGCSRRTCALTEASCTTNTRQRTHNSESSSSKSTESCARSDRRRHCVPRTGHSLSSMPAPATRHKTWADEVEEEDGEQRGLMHNSSSAHSLTPDDAAPPPAQMAAWRSQLRQPCTCQHSCQHHLQHTPATAGRQRHPTAAQRPGRRVGTLAPRQPATHSSSNSRRHHHRAMGLPAAACTCATCLPARMLARSAARCGACG